VSALPRPLSLTFVVSLTLASPAWSQQFFPHPQPGGLAPAFSTTSPGLPLSATNPLSCGVCSSDGKILAQPCPGTGTVRILNLFGPLRVETSSRPTLRIIELWDVAAGKKLHTLDASWGEIALLSFAPDGKVLASSSQYSVHLWEVASGKEIRWFDLRDHGPVRCLAFSPDGKVLAIATTRPGIDLWDVATGTKRDAFRSVGGLRAMAFSPDGQTLASAGDDRTIRLWEIAGGRERTPPVSTTGIVTAITFAPDGKAIAWGQQDGSLWLWTRAHPRPLLLAAAIPATCWEHLSFSPDSRTLASCSVPFTNQFGNLGGNQFGFAGTPAPGEIGNFGGIGFAGPGQAFNPFGPFGFTGMAQPGYLAPPSRTIVLWEVVSGKERCRLPAGGRSVTFRVNGRPVVITGSSPDRLTTHDLAALACNDSFRNLRPDELHEWWNNLIGIDAGSAYVALWNLAALPRQSIPMLRDRVRPAGIPPDPVQLEQLIAALDSDRFAVREKASRDLEAVGHAVEPLLRRTREARPSLEVFMRIERLLDRLIHLDQEEVQQARIVELLEHAAGADAREFLEELSHGLPDAPLTRYARAALERMPR
jgi:hypothetical protein